MKRSVCAGVLLASAFGAVNVTPTSAMQEPDSVVQIEPVLVRVLRSTIGLGAPSPVTVIAGPELTRSNQGAFLQEALRAVPGVQIHNRYNLSVGERIAVRGFGPRSQFGVRGIRVLVDGIPATLPDGQATLDHLDLAGLGRVEVLRGPNGALYGNAAGGVLHFRTLDPALEPAAVSLRSTSSGSDGPWPLRSNLWTVQSNVTGTSGDVGYRFGFSRLNFDGYRRNPIADDGSPYGAARRNVFNGTATVPAGNGTLRFVANAVDLFAENPGSLNELVLAEGQRAAHGFNIISGALKEVVQAQVGTSWMGDLAGMEAEFAAWGVRRDLDNPIPGRVIDLSRLATGLRALVQKATEVELGTFSLGGGFELESQSDDRLNFDNNGGLRGPVILDQDESVRGLGLFLQGRLDLENTGISILGGLRYDRVRFSVDDSFVGADGDDSGSRTMSALSPSVGVVVAPISELEFFGSVTRSFETPTTTELANQPSGAGGFNPGLDPQFGLTFEGGARAAIDGWLLEGTVFHTKLTDGLVPFEVSNRTYFQNAAKTRHVGFEASVDGPLTPWASLRAAFTKVDAEFQEFATQTDDYSGNKVPGLAPKRLDALLDLHNSLGYVEFRWLLQDAVPVDDGGLFESSGYSLVDIRVGSTSLQMGRAEVAPFIGVANVFDETYNSSVVPNAFGSRYFEPGPARTYQVGVGITWGG